MSAFEKSVNCKDIAPLLVFYTCDEVSDTERKHIEAHVANCRACATQLAEENDLQEAMVARRQPADELDSSGMLLSQCRSELAEALDDLSAPPKDRKSTRLNSSHSQISYAVFCLKNKNT